MERNKNILWLILILIAITFGVLLIIFLPKREEINSKINQDNNLNPKDSIEKISHDNISFEIKNIKPITSENYYSSPFFSPDGKKIAITNLNYKGIYVENLIDGTQKKITEDEGAGFRFCWSPDSKAITYLSRKNINGEVINSIKVVEIETGKTYELTTPGIGASMPSFTQSNEVIYSFKGTLIKRKLEDGIIGNEEIINENVPANIIVPSPKGDKIIIEDDKGIKIMDSNGSNKKVVIENGLNEFAHMAKVSFSGNKVLFFNNVGSITHMFIYDIKSEKTRDLGKGYFGQWLPDESVIYCLIEDDGVKNISSDIYIINAEGSSEKITNTSDQIEIQPIVSSDGRFISYLEEKSGKIYYGELKLKNL